jgi:hypothetical protein
MPSGLVLDYLLQPLFGGGAGDLRLRVKLTRTAIGVAEPVMNPDPAFDGVLNYCGGLSPQRIRGCATVAAGGSLAELEELVEMAMAVLANEVVDRHYDTVTA